MFSQLYLAAEKAKSYCGYLSQKNGQKRRKHMEKHGENIRKRKDGRWEGHKQSRSVYAKNYTEVRDKLASAKENAPVSVENTFHDAAEEWLETVRKQRKHSTYVKYQTIYHCYIREKLGAIALEALTQKAVNNLAASADETSSSIHKSIKNVTNQILRFVSVKYDVPACNFVCMVSKPASRPRCPAIYPSRTSRQTSLYRN